MYMLIESVDVSTTYPGTYWLSLYPLFGISESIDASLVETIMLRNELHIEAKENNLTHYQWFDSDNTFYAVVFCETMETINTYFNSELYNKYAGASVHLCGLVDGWKFNGWKIVPLDVLSKIDIKNLNFDVVSELWDKTIPIPQH